MDYGLPGGNDFFDVTEIFESAAAEMDAEELILMDGFGLYDTMTALEIGEPRMDSGVVLDEERRPPFEPLAPLLPEELCYILDRSFSCEMVWHTGYTLSQTVFTFLYVHHLEALKPEFIFLGPKYPIDPSRPRQLVTLVLRAAATGLLKCCDLAWRELTRGRVHDTEDSQSEKSEVSLTEAVPVGTMLAMMDSAISWVAGETEESLPWRNAIMERLSLRLALLNIFRLDLARDTVTIEGLLDQARHHLHNIRTQPAPPIPPADSPAVLAFDPHITRRLSNTMPLNALPLPPQDTTWDNLTSLFDGLAELCQLSWEKNLSTWKIVGTLRSTLTDSHRRLPYVRSLTQSVFYNGFQVFGELQPIWLVDRFFLETLGTEYTLFTTTVHDCWMGNAPPPVRDIEQRLIRLISKDVQSAWFNLPRRRRHLSNSLLEWALVYDKIATLIDQLDITDEAQLLLLKNIPTALRLWRLSTLREMVLSGFTLQLYAPYERPFAYWYTHEVLSKHIALFDEIAPTFPPATLNGQNLAFDRPFLAALREMCRAMFVVTIPLITCSGERLLLNHRKRYKWAFLPQYEHVSAAIAPLPDHDAFLSDCAAALEDEAFSPSATFERAAQLFQELQSVPPGSASQWHAERLTLIQDLSDIARGLAACAPTTLADVLTLDQRQFDWNTNGHRWFPGVRAPVAGA
ncbi:Mak10 subunit, NatC N-terminal acetyltransferase-domain-containing protein [Amylostereum chailletii]|nr:Mak10 subunit, NatC N-terminal acetyltransferase-domain-containing protein [Amylostereum chailletii]